MKKITKLKLCDRLLLCLTVLMLASGLQLEVNPYGDAVWVWAHIVAGSVFMWCIGWHVSLHHVHGARVKPAERRLHGRRHPFLGGLFVLSLLSGIVAAIHWLGTGVHATIGGIHGKIGFLFIIAVSLHLKKHYRFYL